MKKSLIFWKTSSYAFAILLVLPILAIVYQSFGDTGDIFSHLLSTVLPTYVLNTFLLTFGVMVLSFLWGVPSAWLIAMCKLPGSKILQWALVLPLAIPGYIVGYLYTEWFDFAGPIQITLREVTGWSHHDYWFPDFRTIGGAAFVLSLVLYPYVYLLCRTAFMEQNTSILQSARLLKCSLIRTFFSISLPLIRPSIAVALSLVAMETIGDFGTVNYFAVATLTTAVYDTWLGMSNLSAAAKISSLMLLMILLLISAERYSRRRQKLYQSSSSKNEETKLVLTGYKKWCALIWCWGLVCLAFILPLLQLIQYAYIYLEQSWTQEFQSYAMNSLKVSFFAAVVAVLVGLVVNFYQRLHGRVSSVIPIRLASLGYALPGTVLAIGILAPVTAIDHVINDVAKWMEWGRPGLILSGTMVALIFAMVVRFSAVAIGSIESSLNKVPPSLDMAAQTMGYPANKMLLKIHWPLIQKGVLVAGLLVFMESMKELNAALLLRPFNFETLATYVYNYASDEQLEVAAFPAILLVITGLIPLIIVNRSMEKAH
ncbi:iron ABC transporter permease [Vibrio sp.]|nr:iron ABC transporter permease [Vibrio sp.]